jgi:hypothetical protein
VTADAPRPPVEPISTHVVPPHPDEVDLLASESAAVVGEPELAGWWPDPDRLAAFTDELAAMSQSPLVVSRAAAEDRQRELVQRTVPELFPPAVLARRLEGTAYVLAETGRALPARQALAVARTLRERPEAAAALPLVAALVQRALGARLAENQGERRGALVMTPAEFLRDRASSHPRHTRG